MRSVLSSVSSLQSVVQRRTRESSQKVQTCGHTHKTHPIACILCLFSAVTCRFHPGVVISLLLLLFCSILDFTPRDPSLTTRASGAGAPWPIRLLPSYWSPRTDRAPSTTMSPVPTDSTQTAVLSATVLRSTTPGWLMTDISILRPVKEADVKLAGISLAHRSREGRAGGVLVQHCPWLSRPLRAEKRMKTVCPT